MLYVGHAAHWREIRDYLNTLTDEQLDDPAEFATNDDAQQEPIPLRPIVLAGPIEDIFNGVPTRSWSDNDHHPDTIVFYLDGNPYGRDGEIVHNLTTGKPIYGKGIKRWGPESKGEQEGDA
jgi:hypothetical protein